MYILSIRRLAVLATVAVTAIAGFGVPGARPAARPGFIGGSVIDQLGYAVAISGTTVVLGAIGVDNSAGAAYIYERSGGQWALREILTDPRNVPNDRFGQSVAVSDGTILVGAAGVAYAYGLTRGRWRLRVTLTDPVRATRSGFGDPVALAGTTALVGACPSDVLVPFRGAFYAFNRAGTHWHWRATLNDPDKSDSDGFGCVIAASGKYALAGASDAGNPGAAFLYVHSAAGWRLTAKLAEPAHAGTDGFGRDVAISGTTMLVDTDSSGPGDGAAYIYARSGTKVRLQATLTAPAGSFFSGGAALSGATVAIDAQKRDLTQVVYLYARSGARWTRQLVVSGPEVGGTVADSNGTVVAGAPYANGQAGRAVVYRRAGGRWSRAGVLTDPRGRVGDEAGGAVAISGSVAVIGAWGADDQRGAADVYVRSGGRWRRRAALRDPGGAAADYFGAAVGVSGSTVVVGAWATQPDGAAYIYVRSGTGWRLQATLKSPGAFTFGASVAISGSTVLIGAPYAPPGGEAYVYHRSGNRWHRQVELSGPAGASVGTFGAAVALYGSSAVIGAGINSTAFSGSVPANKFAGAAYIYQRVGQRWKLKAALADPDHRPNDGFGTSVAIIGPTVLVGAPGVRDYTGAAYAFAESGTRWRRQAVLTTPRGSAFPGGFGGAVALSGTGARTAALISGLSVSGLAPGTRSCGIAFEYARPSRNWRVIARVADPRCRSYDEFGYSVAISGSNAVIGAPGANGNAGTAYVLSLLSATARAGRSRLALRLHGIREPGTVQPGNAKARASLSSPHG